MKPEEQIEFTIELIHTIKESIFKDIDSGKIPEDWNGIELRWLIAERFQRATVFGGNKKRKAKYDNDVLVNNL